MGRRFQTMMREAWLIWCARVDFDPVAAESVFERLEIAYQAEGRHYHTLSHIDHCLVEWGRAAVAGLNGVDKEALEAAIWFHDVIYRPESTDNERRSAEWAREAMTAGQLAPDFVKIVERLILATDHRRPPDSEGEWWICDIDLSILGQPESVYDAYASAIRNEYHFVPLLRYQEGRAAILRSFLERQSIYATPFFREKYESLARINLRREIARLIGEPGATCP